MTTLTPEDWNFWAMVWYSAIWAVVSVSGTELTAVWTTLTLSFLRAGPTRLVSLESADVATTPTFLPVKAPSSLKMAISLGIRSLSEIW